MQWLNAATFITAANVSGDWSLTAASLDGQAVELTVTSSSSPQFDVWAP
jgi:hypothetical protein